MNRFRMFRAGRSAAFVFLTLLVLGGPGCSSTAPGEESLTNATRAELIERESKKGWINLEAESDPAKRREAIESATALSRSAAASMYERFFRRETVASAGLQEKPSSRPAEPASRPAGFAFEFRDMPLKDMVYLVADELGLNVMVPVPMSETVTVSFPSIDGRRGLMTVLDRYGYDLVEKDGICVVEKKGLEPLETRTFSLDTGITLDVEKQIKPMLCERGRAFADPSSRAVIVTSTREDIEHVASYLEVLDRRQPQVLIEALIVEVVRKTGFRHGAAINFNDIQIGKVDGNFNSNFVPVPPTGLTENPFFIGAERTKSAIDAMLAADETITKVNILHSPFAATVSGKKANLKVTERIPYIQATTNVTAGTGTSNVTSTAQIQYEETGVTLDVTPSVGGDDIVEVLVHPKIAELVGFVQGVPTVDTRESDNTVMVRNHEPLVIAGLLRSAVRSEESRVPVLGEIPIIGELFKRTEDSTEKIELMIFVTPHIMGYGLEEKKGFQAQDHYLGPEKRFPGVNADVEKLR